VVESIAGGCVVEVDRIAIERILPWHSLLTYEYAPFVETAQMPPLLQTKRDLCPRKPLCPRLQR
jgi:hypothetical protein